jgi:hypothetical protein
MYDIFAAFTQEMKAIDAKKQNERRHETRARLWMLPPSSATPILSPPPTNDVELHSLEIAAAHYLEPNVEMRLKQMFRSESHDAKKQK